MTYSILTQTLERDKDELISKIISIVDEMYPKDDLKIVEKGNRTLLRSKLVDFINHTLEKESFIESREVTILLSDLRGFTAMSENYPPTIVIDMLNRYFSEMCDIIVRQHGGIIDKFMGDSTMVLFGFRESCSDDLERALSCAIRMQIAMDKINRQNDLLGLPHLYMGIGINTGIVVTGKVGSELHCEYTVIGDEVNLASRIEAYSLRGQILISENTYRLAKDYIETSDPIKVLAKGKKHPVDLYELLSINQQTHLVVPRREVRRSQRIEVNMPFTYQRVVDKKVLSKEYHGQILDLSYDGILCDLQEPLEAYSEIKFTMTLSMLGGQSSDIYAKVVKVQEFEGRHQAGIEFTSIHINAKEAIKSFIDRIIQGV
ncbi:adenylate/guanylate cyclase domain-containing protein [Thermodesulfobacteriota bacterium]